MRRDLPAMPALLVTRTRRVAGVHRRDIRRRFAFLHLTAVFVLILGCTALAKPANAFLGEWAPDWQGSRMVFEQNGVAHVYEANGSKLEMLYDLKDSRTAILHLPEGGYDVLSIDQDDKFTITHSSMGRTVVWYHFSGPVMTPRMLAFQASGLTLKGDFDGALALWSRIPSSFNPVFSCDNVRFHAGQPVRIIPRSGDIQAAKEAKAKIDSSHFTREAAIAFYQKRRNDFAVTKTCTP